MSSPCRVPPWGDVLAPVQGADITLHELSSNLNAAADTLLATNDRQYDTVSVLITYWAVGNYRTTVNPDIRRLQMLFGRKFGFHVQEFAIPHTDTSMSPNQRLAHRLLDFMEERGQGRHLKIIYYAGNMGTHGKGDVLCQVDRWVVDWSYICRHLKSASSDTLLLLDCYVPACWHMEIDHEESCNEDTAMEAIFRQNTPSDYSFTDALINAFDRIAVGERQIATTGLLFNNILKEYQEWSLLDYKSHQSAPVHLVLKRYYYPRAIQLQPRCNHWHRDNQSCPLSRPCPPPSSADANTLRLLFDHTPQVRLEVRLEDPGVLARPERFWVHSYWALERLNWVTFSTTPCHGSFYVVNIPAAMAAYVTPNRAILRRHFEPYERSRQAMRECMTLERLLELEKEYTDVWNAEQEHALSMSLNYELWDNELAEERLLATRQRLEETQEQMEEFRDRLKDIQERHGTVLSYLGDIMQSITSRVSAPTGTDKSDLEQARDATLKELFDTISEEVDKIDDQVDLTEIREVDLAYNLHNMFQAVHDRFFPRPIDRTWDITDPTYWSKGDWDQPTVEHVEHVRESDKHVSGDDWVDVSGGSDDEEEHWDRGFAIGTESNSFNF